MQCNTVAKRTRERNLRGTVMNRASLTFEQKLNAARFLREGHYTEDIAPKYNVSPRTARILRQRAPALDEFVYINKFVMKKKAMSNGRYPKIEEDTVDFVRLCRVH